VKIGDTVKLKDDPKHDWMFEYLEETFQVVDFPIEDSVKLKMVGTVPDWIWIIEKESVEVTTKGEEE
jgi:hypothetical protein|tara:strand:- start:3381 stop:3581 length:201 start_codon:yes stop_codon:yes gene_type:complete